MTKSRKLNFVERLEWEIGNGVPFNAAIEATVPSEIAKSSLKHILALIQKRHSLLSVRVTHFNDGYAFENINQSIPLTYKTFKQSCISEKQKKKLLEDNLNTPFDNDNPLVRCHCYATATESVLVLTLHHAISDGISGVSLLFEILKNYDAFSLNQEFKFSTKALLPSLESMLPSHLNIKPKAYFSGKDDFQMPHYPPTRTIMHTFSFSAVETKQILKSSKEKRISIQGLLSAAGSIILFQSLHTNIPLEVTTHHLVNMRTHLLEKISNKDLGCIISQINLPVKISPSSILWDIANELSKSLYKKIELGAHFDTLSNLYEWLSQNPSSESVKATARVNEPVFSVSNLGKVEPPNLLNSHLLPKEMIALVTVHNLYPHKNTLMAVAITYHQALCITLLGTEPSVNECFLSDFASKFKAIILNAILG